MTLSLCLGITLKQTLQLRLTQEQKLQLKGYYQELTQKIHGPALSIKEYSIPVCPKCGMAIMSQSEVGIYDCYPCQKKFTDDQLRWEKKLRFYEAGSIASEILSITYFDRLDLREKMMETSTFMTPVQLYESDRVLYINIIHHFGSLKEAFKNINVIYANPAVENWQTTVINYLGIIPDSDIARIVGRSPSAVRYYRIRLNIPSAWENFADSDITDDQIDEIRQNNLCKLVRFREEELQNRPENIREKAKKIILGYSAETDEELRQILLKQHGIKLSRSTVGNYRRAALEEKKMLEQISA